MNKVEGKVSDWCPKCKNCKGITRESNGVHDWLTEVECEDPYDGMTKTLDADSDICCSMFEMIEDLKKRAADSDCYKEMSESLNERNNELKEKLKKANELAESWKRDYERIREQFLCPIYNILYPDNPDLDINVTDLLKGIKDLKIYGDENKKMFKELQEWREKCISRGNAIDHLLSENKEKDKKISELEARNECWSNKDRDKWRELYNSLSNICSDYDKRCKEECEKKYRDEISKLQNIVTEKEVEIKGLRKDNGRLSKDKLWGDMIAEKNTELKQTISDQEITIKALLITIKEMCKEDETDA